MCTAPLFERGCAMDIFKKGWFTEANAELWSGQAFSLEVQEVLYHNKSKYQDILIFQCEAFGKVLALDGVIQLTEKDEFAYHELMTHIPLFSHPNPKSVLVIGGGDGGILREVGKHQMVEEIHICEIDEFVIEACKKHIPSTSIGFDNPKVHIHICDGAEYVHLHKKSFDIIVVDSSDPIGPAKTLFEKTFYSNIKEALKPGGIVASQGMCIWIDIDKDLQYIKELLKECNTLFPVVNYAYSSIPSNTFCQQGFVLASLDEKTDFRRPLRTVSDKEAEEMKLIYYDSDVHQGCFMWPRFLKKELKSIVGGSSFHHSF